MDDPNIERRTAAGIAINLSSYLITGALAVLGAQAVVITFVLDKREGLLWFDMISFLALGCLVLGIISGGKGIYQLSLNGYEGKWEITSRGGLFNLQAFLTLLGVLLVALSTQLGRSKPDSSEIQFRRDVSALYQQVSKLKDALQQIEASRAADHLLIERLSSSVTQERKRNSPKR